MESESSISKSIGLHGHWGFSAPFDIIEAVHRVNGNKSVKDRDLNILLIQPGDIRHILKTLAHRSRHKPSGHLSIPQINIYLLESPVEILARDLILLQLALDLEIPVRQRATVFLEVFGNYRVQKRTSRYIDDLSKRLLQLFSKGTGTLQGILNLEHLNYRERDTLESSLKQCWMQNQVDMDSLWEHRLRGLFEDRYDSRQALYDWDYHTTVKSRASIVHVKQYKQWRHSGIAFEFGDQTYSEPNRTLLSYAEGIMRKGKEKGSKKEVRGFWGDVVNSPFFSLGIDTDVNDQHAQGLFEIYNKGTGTEQHRHHAVEVALHSLFCVLWELETGSPYRLAKPHDVYSGLGAAQQRDIDEQLQAADPQQEIQTSDPAAEDLKGELEQLTVIPEDEGEAPADETKTRAETALGVNQHEDLVQAILQAENMAEAFRGVQVFPLTGAANATLPKAKFQGLFDFCFVSTRAAHLLGEPLLSGIMRRTGTPLLAAETGKFVVPLSTAVKKDFCEKQRELAATQGWAPTKETPVQLRHRDEEDKEDDVTFFTRKSTPGDPLSPVTP